MFMALGDIIEKLRKSVGITQEELSKKIGISRGTLSMYEINKREPDYETLRKIAGFFNVSIDYLLSHEEKTDKENTPPQTDQPKGVNQAADKPSIFKTLFGGEPDPVRDAIMEFVSAYLHEQREAILDNHDIENNRELYNKVGQFIDKNVSRIASRAFRDLRITDYDYIKNASTLPENVINHIREIINVELLALSVTEQEEKPIMDRWDQLKKDLLDSLNPDRMTINGDTSSFVYDPDLFLQFGNLPKKMTPEYLKDLEESLKRVDEKLKQLKPGDPPIWEIDPRKYDKR
jgi:transcriptional regulator with XRE-family HTH domain